jgi:hypothetical protein
LLLVRWTKDYVNIFEGALVTDKDVAAAFGSSR